MENYFSLILCTIGRIEDVRQVLESFTKQGCNNFECIIVDQNPDDILGPIVDCYKSKITIKHIRSSVRGLSKNRNIGIKAASGNIIAFPDDDCQYPPSTLNKVSSFFYTQKEVDVLTINIKDPHKELFAINEKGKFYLNRYNYRPYGISIGIFIKYKEKADIVFDEQLGAGAKFGADEESDLVSSLIEKKYTICYCGQMNVLHLIGLPELPVDKMKRRYETYGLGYGALMKKEILYRHKYRLIYNFSKETFGRLIAGILPFKKREYYMISALARLRGFIQYKLKNE